MNFRAIFHAFLVAFACLGLLATPVHASNPLKSLGSGLKRVSGNLNPFKRLKAARVEKPAAKPAAKPLARTPATKPASKPAGSVKKSPGPKPLQSPALATASKPKPKSSPPSKPKAKPAKTAAAPATAMAAAGAAGAAGPEKPADPDSSDESETGSTADSSPPEPTSAKPPANLPFATPVMGRKGHVRSPFAEDQGMVDVSDIPAGTKVRCPYSGKVFRVP